MITWVGNCRCFRFRRRRIAFIFTLALATFILALQINIYTVQVIQSEKGDVVVQTNLLRPLETLPTINLTAEQHVNTALEKK